MAATAVVLVGAAALAAMITFEVQRRCTNRLTDHIIGMDDRIRATEEWSKLIRQEMVGVVVGLFFANMLLAGILAVLIVGGASALR
jgi:hypothetical protein